LHVRWYAANLQEVIKALREDRRMDFNTGSSGGRPDDESRPLYGGEGGGTTGGPPRGPAGSPGGEFSLQDPVGSFVRTVQGVLRSPVAFFRGLARQGDFINPAVFALICALISALLGGILSLIFTPLFAGPGDTGEAFAGGIAGFVISLILTPIYAAIALLVVSGVFHLLALLFVRPSNAGFEATFRVVSYSWVYQLISWIPVIGWIAGPIYGIVLSIFGIREVHNTTTGKAAAIVLIPVVVVLLLVLILVALIGAALFFGTQQQQF
jgi:hypothetical protein